MAYFDVSVLVCIMGHIRSSQEQKTFKKGSGDGRPASPSMLNTQCIILNKGSRQKKSGLAKQAIECIQLFVCVHAFIL